MRLFECENCFSIFIVNEADKRIKCGSYHVEETLDCPLCSSDMTRIDFPKNITQEAL